MPLRDTIFHIQSRDSELSAIAADREDFIRQWRIDLGNLYKLMRLLLQDLVEEGSVSFSDLNYKIKEDELGEYEAPGLQINIASRTISATPIARLTSGGTGRVDLYRRDRPSESERIFVVRRRDPEGEAPWLIEQKSEEDPIGKYIAGMSIAVGKLMNKPQRIYNMIEKKTFENALDYLLRVS